MENLNFSWSVGIAIQTCSSPCKSIKMVYTWNRSIKGFQRIPRPRQNLSSWLIISTWYLKQMNENLPKILSFWFLLPEPWLQENRCCSSWYTKSSCLLVEFYIFELRVHRVLLDRMQDQIGDTCKLPHIISWVKHKYWGGILHTSFCFQCQCWEGRMQNNIEAVKSVVSHNSIQQMSWSATKQSSQIW